MSPASKALWSGSFSMNSFDIFYLSINPTVVALLSTLYSRMFVCSRNRFSCFATATPTFAGLRHFVSTLFPPDFPLTPYFLQHFLPPISFPAASDFINQQHARLEHPLRCHLGPPRPPLRLPRFWYSLLYFMSEPFPFTRSLMA